MPAAWIGGRVNVAQRPARGRRKRLGRYTDAMAADDVRFEIMTSIADAPAVVAMMNGLYDEDPASGRLDRGRFGRTIEIFLAQPQRGSVMLIRVGGELAGYALLVPYFSNELGGVILFIDELFVLPPHRGRGLGRGLIGFLASARPMDAVALGLEVTPSNTRARGLYERLGFAPRRNTTMIRRL